MGYENGSPTSPSFLAYAKSPFLSPYVYAGGQIYENHLDVTDETYLDEALSNYAGYNYKLANPYAIGVYGDAENKNRFENSMLNVAVTPRYQITPNLSVSEHFSYNLISSNEKPRGRSDWCSYSSCCILFFIRIEIPHLRKTRIL